MKHMNVGSDLITKTTMILIKYFPYFQRAQMYHDTQHTNAVIFPAPQMSAPVLPL